MAMGTLEILLVLSIMFLLPAEAQQGRAATPGVLWLGGVMEMGCLRIFYNEKLRSLRRGGRQKKGARSPLEPCSRAEPLPPL